MSPCMGTLNVLICDLTHRGFVRVYYFGVFCFQTSVVCFCRIHNPVVLILSSKNDRFRRPSKDSAS